MNPSSPSPRVRFAELLAALSRALDLADAEPMGHGMRTCLVALELAERVSLPAADARDVYFAALLVHAGAPGSGEEVARALHCDDRRALAALHRTDWSCDLAAFRWATRHLMPRSAPPRRALR
ncbi:MAG TPA: hypothetical protein VFK69_09855, partial [Candidatus Eisenbacteria bacterium]|nr:hypothetical protein [Candidatus Eisenbacteria bacterium]